MHTPSKNLTSRGFTVVELLIVIVVIGILAAISIVTYGGVQQNARDKSISSDLDNVAGEITRYSVNNAGMLGTAIQWYSGGAVNPNIQAVPTAGNVIDVVATSTDYCIRGYNPSANKNSITNSYAKGSTDLACATMPASAAAGGTGGAIVGWWKFNGNANSSVNTLSDGVVTGAVPTTGQNTQPNQAFAFTNGNQYFVANNIQPVTTQLTLSAWIQPSSYPVERSTILEGLNPYSYYLSLANDGSLQTYWYGTSIEGYHSTATNVIPLNSWTLVTATWDGTTMNIYTNGVLRKSVAVTGPGVSSNKIFIGNENGARQFIGSIDDARVYNRALTAAEILALNSQGAQ